MKKILAVIIFISLLSFTNAQEKSETFSTIDISQYCTGIYPDTYCHNKNTLSKKLGNIIESYIKNNREIENMTREQKNTHFRIFQEKTEKYASIQINEKRKFIFLYLAAIFDYHANQNIVFDGCGSMQSYLNKYPIILKNFHQWLLYEYNVGGGPLGSGTTYSELKPEQYSLDWETCLSKDKKLMVFFLSGGRFCKDIYRYATHQQKPQKVRQDEQSCPLQFGKRNNNGILLKGNLDGAIYEGIYNYINNQITNSILHNHIRQVNHIHSPNGQYQVYLEKEYKKKINRYIRQSVILENKKTGKRITLKEIKLTDQEAIEQYGEKDCISPVEFNEFKPLERITNEIIMIEQRYDNYECAGTVRENFLYNNKGKPYFTAKQKKTIQYGFNNETNIWKAKTVCNISQEKIAMIIVDTRFYGTYSYIERNPKTKTFSNQKFNINERDKRESLENTLLNDCNKIMKTEEINKYFE